MKQVVQDIRSGVTAVRDLPDPIVQPHSVLVANLASLVSVGTERYVVELARQSLLAKARQRPDYVKRVMQKVRQEGLFTTVRQVRARLDEPMPLGYSSAGIVLAVGDRVSAFKVGDRVAAVGPHAGIVAIGENLCAKMSDNVTFEQAAYTAVGAIALEGVRLANTALGAQVLVIGLGLIGQIAACLLKANGVKVLGTDLDPRRLEQARALGIDAVHGNDVRARALSISDGHGVDAVLITASTASNGPIELAADVCRQKGRIVLVGVAGLAIPRPPFFEKELEFTVSHSLGAGRSDREYEEKAVDYPIGYARWTAKRNMETVLETIASGALPVDKLTTHRFPIERAADAYELVVSGGESLLGVLLTYDYASGSQVKRRVSFTARPAASSATGVSIIGAGNFARLVLLPELQTHAGVTLRGVCSAKGLNAEHTGRKAGFAFAATDPDEVFGDADTSAVFILTRHDLHADLVIRALTAGKHVFVEKPLCITPEELQRIARSVEGLGDSCPILTVGFNRRFAPATVRIQSHFAGVAPLAVSFRFAVPDLAPDMWVHDRDVGGGRIVGEACHAIDTCVAIAGSAPARVYAESAGSGGGDPLDDRVFITIRHENRSISIISYQAGGDRSGPTERIEVFGGGRTAVVDNWDQIELWADNRRATARGNKDRGHKAEIAAFMKACRHGGTWPIPWSDLRHDLGDFDEHSKPSGRAPDRRARDDSARVRRSRHNLTRMTINWSAIRSDSAVGRLIRVPLHLLPARLMVPILAGANRGFRWRVGSFDHGCWLGSFEAQKQIRLRESVREGMTAFDIGAHVGFYTLLLSRAVGETGRVFAFEPWPANTTDCVAHVRLNHLSNVVVVPAAVSDANGLTSFAVGPSTSTGALAPSDTGLRVACFSLDELIASRQCPIPDVIKVDVEGAESRVLEGAQALLRSHSPKWFVALHSPDQKRACLDLFVRGGYTVCDLEGRVCDPAAPENLPDEIVAIRN